MAKIANTITQEEKMAKFKRTSNSKPVKVTKEYLQEKNSTKKKANKSTSQSKSTYDKEAMQQAYNRTFGANNQQKPSSTANRQAVKNNLTNKDSKATVNNDHITADKNKLNSLVGNNKNRNPISSEAYKQNKIQEAVAGKQKANVSEMNDAYNDSFLEKGLQTLGNTGLGLATTALKGYDVLKEAFMNGNADFALKFAVDNPVAKGLQYVDDVVSMINPDYRDFKATDEDNLSSKLDKKVKENQQNILYGTEGLERFALQTLEGTGNFAGHLLLSAATGGAANPLVTMSVQSGTDKTYKNLQEGYDYETALGNGVLTGLMTSLTERLPLDNLTKIVGSNLGQFSLAALATQSISEGLEEGAEYLFEPLIDKLTLGKQVEYSPGELFMSVALGMSSGALIGAGANVVPIVNKTKTANQLKADINVLNEYKNTAELTYDEELAINQAIALAQKAINDFEKTSVVGNAVVFKNDEVKQLSVREIQENFNRFMKVEADHNAQITATQESVNNILNNAQTVLNRKGIRMDAVQYANLNEDIKKQVDSLQQVANDLGQDVIFNTEMYDMNGNVIDGMYIEGQGIVINPLGNNPALSTFIHELTHGIESSNWYAPLKRLIIDSNANFVQDIQTIKELYKSVTELDSEGASKEYVAISTQEMLGNDRFVDRLVRYNTSLANRIYEGIKHLVSTTDTAQDIEYNFLKAFRNRGIDASQVKTQYSFKDAKGKDIVLNEQQELENAKKVLEMEPVYSIQENKFAKNPDKNLVEMAGEYFASFGNTVFRDDIGEVILNEKGVKSLLGHLPRYQDKYAAIEALPTVIENGEIINSSENWKGRTKDTIIICAPVLINDEIKYMSVVVEQDEFLDNKYYVHELIMLEQEYKKNPANSLNKTQSFSGEELSEFTYNILKNAKNIKYSIDSQGRTLTAEQQAYFQDSKVRDENGNLKVLYHGTPNGEFTVFDANRIGETTDDGEYGAGFYFTDVKDGAQSYATGENSKVYETYLNLTNPLRLDKVAEYNRLYTNRMDHEEILQQIGLSEEEFEVMSNAADILDDNWQGYTIEDLGFDGVIQGTDEGHIYVATNPNQIKNVTNTNPTSNPDIRYSIGLNKDSLGRELSQEQQTYFDRSAMRDEEGNLKPFYHGTSRADRVGYYFDPERATSGPMAYFTDNKEIANNYAKDKADTSIAYDERYDSPKTQFRINHNGNDIPVGDLWNTFTYREKQEFKKKAKELTKNWDNEDELELYFEEGNQYGIGNLTDYEIHRNNGNVINTLVESWIESGDLWGEEHQFLEVLKAMGIEDAYYLDPEYRDEKTYEVYLNIENPFNTSDVDETFVEDLQSYIDNADMSKYDKESQHADMWDKNSADMDDWIFKLEDDIRNGTSHVWTTIPDVVTDFLKANGHDGILDLGGKRGGDIHQVAIPFYSNQIKETTNKKPTVNTDIRYSIGLSAKEIKNSYKQYKEVNDNFANSFGQIVNKKDMDADYKELLSSTVLEKIKTGQVSYDKLETLKTETWNRLYDYEVNPEYETYKNVKDTLKKQRISMSSLGFDDRRFDENKRGISDFAGKEEWNEFRKKHMGTFKFVKSGGTDIDEIYTSLVREYPGLLEENANNGYDQLMEIANYLDNKQEEIFKVHQSEQGVTYEMFEEDFNSKIENMIHSIDTKKEIAILMSKNNIRKNPENAILSAGAIIPNHDIIRQKYPEFSEFNFNKALLEQYTNGRATDETVKALKEDLIKNVYGDDATKGNFASKQVDEFLDDSIKYFLANAKYESNKDYMNSIASQAIELLKSYNSIDREKIESTYDKVEMKEKAKELIRKNNLKRKVSVAHAVDNLIFNGSDVRMSMFKTMEQNFDVVANGNVNLRNDLRDTLEMKRFEAQNKYKEILEKYGSINDKIVNELGIKGKSKESKGMQWFMELHKEDGSSYNQQQLLLDFDYLMPNGKKAYENIMEAAKLQSDSYEELIKSINEGREDIYGDIDINNELQTKELQAEYQQAKHTMQQISDELKNHPTEKLEAAYEQAREEVRKLYKKLQSKIQRDENGDSTRRQKLQYRKNYAHHIVKKGFLSSLIGKIDGSAVREVPTYLAGISDDAEPKTGFAKFFSKQTGGAYEADAVNGFAEYIKDAARIISYDPYIDYVRGFADDIRAVAQDDEMSQFTRYLTDYANDIAGKTGKIDRAVREMVGDKAFGVIKTLNSRVKANAILGNIRTATTQIFNIPNALGVLADNGRSATTQDVMKGVTSYMNSILTNQNDDSDASPFITSRYFDVNTQSKGIGAKLENISNFMLSKGDEISTKMIWNAAYQQALRTNQENPVFYADDLTRRAVAGRGVGEVPLALQSQFMNLMIPFQIETNNAFKTLSSKVKDKKVGSVLTILLANWIFNAISEALYGDRLLFDPIDVIGEAIDDYNEDEEKDEFESIKNTIKRLFGETLGSIPGGTYLPMILGWNEDESQNFFGESDPTRYGTGNIGLSVIGSALQDIDKGNYLDAASDLAANFALPGGGKQLQRTIEALQVNGMLPQYENGKIVKEPVYYTGSGKVGYVTDPEAITESPENFFDFAKQAMFGKWAGKNAQEYINSGFKSMGKTQTNIFDVLNEGMNSSDSFSLAEQVYEAKKTMTGDDGRAQFFEYLSSDDFTPEQRNEIYDTYYGDDKFTIRINEFASGCKLNADQTFTVKKILTTTESLKDSNGETIDHSKALSVRKQLDELGLYDDVVKFIQENNLQNKDMNLTNGVVKMSNSEFESKYKSVYGTKYESKTKEEMMKDAYAKTFGKSSSSKTKSNSSSKNKSSSNSTKTNNVAVGSTTSIDEQKTVIDNLIAKIYGKSSSKNSYDVINDIMKKVNNSKKSTSNNVKNNYSDLIKKYLKEHPYDAELFK